MQLAATECRDGVAGEDPQGLHGGRVAAAEAVVVPVVDGVGDGGEAPSDAEAVVVVADDLFELGAYFGFGVAAGAADDASACGGVADADGGDPTLAGLVPGQTFVVAATQRRHRVPAPAVRRNR